jgi:putative endonuclease
VLNSLKTGAFGEDIAAQYLRKQGYRILFRNKKWPWGELDLVTHDREGTLVIVEVKTRWGLEANPEQNYTFDKDRKTKRATSLFIAHHPELIDEVAGYRVDVIAVQIKTMILRNWEKDCEIRHYKNV